MRTVKDRIAWFREHTPERQGLCLRHTWQATDIPPLGLDEAEDGVAVVKRSGHMHTDRNPPRGAWVWWTGGESGHVCLSLGDHRILSTDVNGQMVGSTGLSYPEVNWGFTYEGWSDWYGVPFTTAQTRKRRLRRLLNRLGHRIRLLRERRRHARKRLERHG